MLCFCHLYVQDSKTCSATFKPKTQKGGPASQLGDRSFAVDGPRMSNMLPVLLCLVDNNMQVRCLFDVHLIHGVWCWCNDKVMMALT